MILLLVPFCLFLVTGNLCMIPKIFCQTLMREPKLRLLMMIMKCLVLGCVIDNKGGGMRILNVNNGNHDRRTDTPSGYTF